MQRITSVKFRTFFVLLDNFFLPHLKWKFIVIKLPVTFLSFGCLYFIVLVHAAWIWIDLYFLIYGDPVICLFSIFASLKYILLISPVQLLRNSYGTPRDKAKLVLNLHSSWKTIYLKIIALFLSSFWCTESTKSFWRETFLTCYSCSWDVLEIAVNKPTFYERLM